MDLTSIPSALNFGTKNPLPVKNLTIGQQLESVFLSEMLKAGGVGKTPETFGGGSGEDQFSSFLRDAQSREMARAGGLGLAPYFEKLVKD